MGPNFQQSGITSTATPGDWGGSYIIWQLAYAWQATTVTNEMGMNNYLFSLTATPRPVFNTAIGQQANSLTTITPNRLTGYSNFSTSLGAGRYITPEISFSSGAIPANTYFMVAMAALPGITTYSRSTNSTALVNGQPFVTMTNMIFYSTSGASSDGTPVQVGGPATGYVFQEGLSLVATYKFS